jgi:uncharacterized protein YfbU (UPF0304 family)
MKLSDGEKLILVMLCDIYKELGIKGEVEANFVKSAINSGNLWGLKARYHGVFEMGDRDPRTVSEVGDILEMWWFMETAYKKMSKADQDRVKEAHHFGQDLKFPGFDGNNEGEHHSVALFLVRDLDRFEGIGSKHDLNSHCPSLDGYRRMLEVFAPLRRSIAGRELSATEIIELLNARAHPENR